VSMSTTVLQDDLSAGVIADLVDRLEDVAHLLAAEMPNAIDLEQRMALDLGRMRCIEAAAMIAALATLARPPEVAA
jgi:hypothetical protein